MNSERCTHSSRVADAPSAAYFKTRAGRCAKPFRNACGPRRAHGSRATIAEMSTAARNPLFDSIREAILATYGDRLVAVAIFGSWARGTATPASDLDVLVIADPLPTSRMKRVREFQPVEDATRSVRATHWSGDGPEIELSPIFKTPAELAAGSPLYLDMTLWSVLLIDRGGILKAFLERLRGRMESLGSRRVPFKGGAYWDYKPDFRPGDVVEL